MFETGDARGLLRVTIKSQQDSCLYVKERVRLRIKGRVQGVFFRATARDVARKLGLTGFVKNLSDGNTVLAEAQGPTDKIQEFIKWCHQGPPAARVDEVIVERISPIEDEPSFEVRYY